MPKTNQVLGGVPFRVPVPGGGEIAGEAAGEGGPALVLVHGWCCSRGHWDRVFDPLAERRRVVALDLPGHGESSRERPPENWSIPHLGEDVAAVVRQVAEGPVILVGHSMGGPVSAEAAARLGPDLCRGVVAVDAFHDVGQPFRGRAREKLLASYREDFAGTGRKIVPTIFSRGTDPAVVQRVTDEMVASDPAIALALIEASFAHDQGEALRRLATLGIPVRAIQGTLMPTNVPGNRAFHPAFDAVVLDSLAHFPHLEDPPAFLSALEETLAGMTAT